ncbi:hypothetical protein MPL3365_140164 [Mesorhizobium plurifarium]|uniref:Uncharacterized protein n=1 Tax=Mesorhizobium plurifarium TaxID=69974 RepID=A0A090G4F4_MESPL|nr:hypothetical protein MPL3365_140164 [Mesorhizobium plurifarium]
MTRIHDPPRDSLSFAQATNGTVEFCCLACDSHILRFPSESPFIATRAAEVISKGPQQAHWNSTLRSAISASKASPAQIGHLEG